MAGRVDEGWADGWSEVVAGEAMDDGKQATKEHKNERAKNERAKNEGA